MTGLEKVPNLAPFKFLTPKSYLVSSTAVLTSSFQVHIGLILILTTVFYTFYSFFSLIDC